MGDTGAVDVAGTELFELVLAIALVATEGCLAKAYRPANHTSIVLVLSREAKSTARKRQI